MRQKFWVRDEGGRLLGTMRVQGGRVWLGARSREDLEVMVERGAVKLEKEVRRESSTGVWLAVGKGAVENMSRTLRLEVTTNFRRFMG